MRRINHFSLLQMWQQSCLDMRIHGLRPTYRVIFTTNVQRWNLNLVHFCREILVTLVLVVLCCSSVPALRSFKAIACDAVDEGLPKLGISCIGAELELITAVLEVLVRR